MTSHGKKGWTSKTNIKEDLKYVCLHNPIVLKIVNILFVIFRTTKGTSTIDGGPSKSVSIAQGRALGPNPDLRRGPNDDLLLYAIYFKL